MVRSMSERRVGSAQRSELTAALLLVGLCPVLACAGSPKHIPAHRSLTEEPHRRLVVEPALKARGPNFIAYFEGDANVRVFTGGEIAVRRGRGSDGGRTLHVVADEFGEGCDLPSLSFHSRRPGSGRLGVSVSRSHGHVTPEIPIPPSKLLRVEHWSVIVTDVELERRPLCVRFDLLVAEGDADTTTVRIVGAVELPDERH